LPAGVLCTFLLHYLVVRVVWIGIFKLGIWKTVAHTRLSEQGKAHVSGPVFL
jgi:hypothetical protein